MDHDWQDAFDFAWPAFGLIDDVRPALANAREGKRTIALATLINADGPSPRPVGAHMVIDPGVPNIAGYLSGGCIEGVVAQAAIRTLEEGSPLRLVFGRGSPYFDVKLTCGSRIEIWVDRLRADDEATGILLEGWQARWPMLWSVDLSTGARECCKIMGRGNEPGLHASGLLFQMTWAPTPKLIVAGSDPVALAVADLGIRSGWEVVLHRPRGPATIDPLLEAARYHNKDSDDLFATETIDSWTAIVCTSHDIELDHVVLVHALSGPAFYVGVLGSRTKLAERRHRLIACNLGPTEIQRLHAPVGLQIGGETSYEIAVAIWADLIRTLHHG